MDVYNPQIVAFLFEAPTMIIKDERHFIRILTEKILKNDIFW